MKKILSMVMVLAIAAPLAGCIVRTGPRHSHGHRGNHARACPPAHHWNGHACVHNGKARGHRR